MARVSVYGNGKLIKTVENSDVATVLSTTHTKIDTTPCTLKQGLLMPN